MKLIKIILLLILLGSSLLYPLWILAVYYNELGLELYVVASGLVDRSWFAMRFVLSCIYIVLAIASIVILKGRGYFGQKHKKYSGGDKVIIGSTVIIGTFFMWQALITFFLR